MKTFILFITAFVLLWSSMTLAAGTQYDLRLDDLNALRKELQLLLNLCRASKNGYPIIEGMDTKSERQG